MRYLITFLFLMTFTLLLGETTLFISAKSDGIRVPLAQVSSINFNIPETDSRNLFITKTRKVTDLSWPIKSKIVPLSQVLNITFPEGISNIQKEEILKKLGISLLSNYPNPFNPTTTIKFMTEKKALTKVEVFNQTGQLVKQISNSVLESGMHSIKWDATNLTTGTYFTRVSQNGMAVYSKMILIK